MGVMNGTQRVEVLLAMVMMLMTVMRVKSRVQRCLNSKYYFAPSESRLSSWLGLGGRRVQSFELCSFSLYTSPFTPALPRVRASRRFQSMNNYAVVAYPFL